MTALVSGAFRVLAAGVQRDDARVEQLLAELDEAEVCQLADLLTRLHEPVAVELAHRGHAYRERLWARLHGA